MFSPSVCDDTAKQGGCQRARIKHQPKIEELGPRFGAVKRAQRPQDLTPVKAVASPTRALDAFKPNQV